MKISTLSFVHNNYQVREEQLNGRGYLVVPVTMMVEGVHHGSKGPLLYTTEELSQHTHSWNGTVVTMTHPGKDGEGVTANSPEAANYEVGRVYNAHMDGDKLKAEVWLDLQLMETNHPHVLDKIRDGVEMDVSIGVFSGERGPEGVWNNEQYRAQAVDLRPDHLALLPNEVGACSWDDGCGIRNNQTGNDMNDKNLFNTALKAGFVLNAVLFNEQGARELMQLLQTKLDGMDNGTLLHYLEELYDGDFVYRVENNTIRTTTYFRDSYTTNEDGTISFGGSPEQVKKEISFTSINTNMKRNNPSNSMKTNAKPCTVDALIENKAINFTEEDREFLSSLPQEQLEKMSPKMASNAQETQEEETETQEAVEQPVANEGPVDNATIEATIKKVLKESKDPITFIDNFMPDGLKGQMKTGLKMYQEKRTQVIEGIVKNSKFTKDKLESWSDEDLDNLHESVVGQRVDYSIQAPTAIPNTNQHGRVGEVAVNSMLGITETK